MTIQEFYAVTSGNYDEALKRLMRPDFVKRFALKYLTDPSFAELTSNLESDNTEVAFRAAHTMKRCVQEPRVHQARQQRIRDHRAPPCRQSRCR